MSDILNYPFLVATGNDPFTTSPISVNALGPYGWIQIATFVSFMALPPFSPASTLWMLLIPLARAKAHNPDQYAAHQPYIITDSTPSPGGQEATWNPEQYQMALHWADNGRQGSLTRFNLSGADLRLVDLAGANLTLANLSGADLEEANLSQADLRQANLNWADLEAAILSGADLRRVILISKANLSGAKYDSFTTWPAGFNPEKAGAIQTPPIII